MENAAEQSQLERRTGRAVLAVIAATFAVEWPCRLMMLGIWYFKKADKTKPWHWL